MVLGACTICTLEQAKYKCPKCPAEYCSLKCYKAPQHEHTEMHKVEIEKREEPTAVSVVKESSKYQDVFDDEKLRYLLSFRALKVHLFAIYEILTDMTLTPDKRRDMSDEKLNSLRLAGAEENELVEEFCERVTELLQATST